MGQKTVKKYTVLFKKLKKLLQIDVGIPISKIPLHLGTFSRSLDDVNSIIKPLNQYQHPSQHSNHWIEILIKKNIFNITKIFYQKMIVYTKLVYNYQNYQKYVAV